MPKLHEGLRKSLLNKTKLLLSNFTEFHPPEKQTKETEIYTAATITESDIVEEIKYYLLSDIVGNTAGIVVFKNNKEFALEGEYYESFLKTVDQIYSSKDFRAIVGYKFIYDRLLEWIVASFRGEDIEEFPSFLESSAKESVHDYDIWIPIPFTFTDVDFVLGKTHFTTITEARIQGWMDPVTPTEEADNNKEDLSKFVQHLREKYQGHMAGTFSLRCEISKALEISYECLSDSLSALRLFSPSNFIPELSCGAYEYGWKMYESEQNIVLSVLPSKTFKLNSSMRDKMLHWRISEELVSALNNKYNKFHELLSLESRNSFQQKLLDSLRIYSRHTLRRSVFDKLLYILTAIESILLKNNTEPIQQNLADRIAFALSSSNDGRRKIVRLVKGIYAIRSKYIHHGNINVESNQAIRRFLGLSWNLFASLVNNMNNFENKEQCIEAIENIKYS